MGMRLKIFSRFLLLTLLLSGAACQMSCHISKESLEFFNQHLGAFFNVRMEPYTSPGSSSGAANTAAGACTAPSPSGTGDAAIHRQFLTELYSVVLNREPTPQEFQEWLNVLSQQGSYEGIYHGIAQNEEYRAREVGAAPLGAMKLYADLMTEIALEARYDPLTLKEKQRRAEGTEGLSSHVQEKQANSEEIKKLKAQYEQAALSKSFFTLKRETVAEALRMMELKRDYHEKFATWFGKFVLFTNGKNVDFGLAERNANEEQTHYRWALTHTDDQVRWEVINRIHRLFNAAAKQ